MLIRILLALEDRGERRRVREALRSQPNVHVETLATRGPLWNRVSRKSADLCIVSTTLLPEDPSEILSELRDVPDTPEFVVLGHGQDRERRTRLLAAGCLAVLDDGLTDRLLREALAGLVDRKQGEFATARTRSAAGDVPRLRDFHSRSPRMQAFLHVAERVTPSDATLLYLGETGVGKEHLARAIHNGSPRSQGPFIAVNCAAIPETLLESELFGHTEGAFTGANRERRGLFELAHGGTLFLDEIGEMPPHLQVKLLRALQDRAIQRVGAEETVQVDVRLMAATHRDLEEDVQQGNFRPDLYYRLSVVSLSIPPLRQRKEDIPSLVERYVDHFRARFASDVRAVSPAALNSLTRYPWPGNVRELVNVIERAMLLGNGPTIELADLPEVFRGDALEVLSSAGAATAPPGELSRLVRTDSPLSKVAKSVLEAVEIRYLDELLREARGRVGLVAKRAGLNPRTLYAKMRRHGLRKEDYRA